MKGRLRWATATLSLCGRQSRVAQKSRVGVCFMPFSAGRGPADAGQSDVFGPELLAPLEGRLCFHIGKLTPVVRDQTEAALRAGCHMYVLRGWV